MYAGDRSRLTPELLAQLDDDLYVSPMVELELTLLHEIGRVVPTGAEVISDLERRIGLRVCDLPFHEVVASAADQDWTRDPFDRLIVGQAAVNAQPLATRDRRIRENYDEAFWV
jgi:PIN domain nuclease of toxin-antitoxin system